MTPAPPFDCDDCGRRIGKTSTHLILDDGRVVCIRHHDEHNDASRITHHASRAWAARAKGIWP